VHILMHALYLTINLWPLNSFPEVNLKQLFGVFFMAHCQSHMILQKSFKYENLVLKKHFLFISTSKTGVVLNIFKNKVK